MNGPTDSPINNINMQQSHNKPHKQTLKTPRSGLNHQKYREIAFNNRYSLTQKAQEYEALNDPYTSYYFANKSVKQHLKMVKKALKQEHNNTQKNRIKKLITLRLNEKYQDFLNPKKSIYQKILNSDQFNHLGKTSLQNLQNRSRKSVDFAHTKVGQTRKKSGLPVIKGGLLSLNTSSKQAIEGLKTEEVKEQVEKSTQKQLHKIKANKLTSQLHEQRHKKWISFLQEKKRMLQTGNKASSVDKDAIVKESPNNEQS